VGRRGELKAEKRTGRKQPPGAEKKQEDSEKALEKNQKYAKGVHLWARIKA